MIKVQKKDGFIYDNRQLIEFCVDVIEAFEDFLDERGIVIENDEKAESEGPCNIYGTDFGELENAVTSILYSYGLVEEVEING